MQNTKLNRIQKAFAIFLLIATIFSAAFCAAEHDHDCCGDDCPVCAVIQIAEACLKLVAVFLAIFASKLFANFSAKKYFFTKQLDFFYCNTLFLLKTRLND